MRSYLYTIAFASLLLPASTCPAVAHTWIVAQDGTGDFSSVAAACQAASAGDSVLIRPGEYREEEHDDPMDPEILITDKPLSILGDGALGTISLNMKFGFVNCNGVMLSNLRLHDLPYPITIWGGNYFIRSCHFEGNLGRSPGGGAILVENGAVTIEDSIFKKNEYLENYGASEGGGAVHGINLTIRRCIFQSNRALRRGGAIFTDGNLVVEDCLFLSNSSPHGAAVAMGDGAIKRSTFHKNDCLDGMGGAIQVFGDQYQTAPDHCIIAGTIGGFGIECPAATSARCCDFWDNDLGSDPGLWCGLDPANGNFSEDPLFCDAEGGDFGLLENSPCRPGGHNGYECGRIGFGVEYCGIIRTEETGWGKLKMLWR